MRSNCPCDVHKVEGACYWRTKYLKYEKVNLEEIIKQYEELKKLDEILEKC